MTVSQDRPYKLFHLWLILASLTVFACFLIFDSGIYGYIVDQDPTRLSILISLLFAGGTLHCGALALGLSREAAAMDRLYGGGGDGFLAAVARTDARESRACGYLRALHDRLAAGGAGTAGEYTQLTDVLAEQVRGQHEAGWFVTNMLVKLGLLGTVIGFILMLSSVMSIESFAIEDAQSMLGTMTVGMGVALNTTMLGLVSSMLLGMQYLLVDRGADRLVADAVFIAESELVPGLAGGPDGV
ncbi:MAG: MotA/TolQ/ExbB proton channel family protein [Gammaproteobacteria bacterium]